MTDVLIVLSFGLTYFILLGIVNFCHFLMGLKGDSELKKSKRNKK